MLFIQGLIRFVFFLLYHQFAWTYDFVSGVVSLGRWQEWVNSSIPYLNGRILELGFGTGHLQRLLDERGYSTFGVDGSRQMVSLARRRLQKHNAIPRLTIGYAQNLPFIGGGFDSVVATFPAEYIIDRLTLQEIQRVLTPTGRLIILPMAWFTGKHPLERLAAWLFKITGETPGKPGITSKSISSHFAGFGFEVHSEMVELLGSQVLVIIATVPKSI